ncbi:MAG TPA: glycoside hydrolase family 95 protein [Capsulimonadaceae bacterium]|jgi:alpha-L-fucosidase 2
MTFSPNLDDATDGNLDVWLNEPAREWHEALPLGNGKIGAMVFGGIHCERIALNEDTLWSGEPVEPDPTAKWHHLQDVRRLTLAGEYAAAEEAAKQLQGPYTQSYLPLGDLVLQFDHAGAASNYSRRLKLGDATADVVYTIHGVRYRRRHFVSAPANVFVIQIEASAPGAISFTASLTTQLRGNCSRVSSNRLLLSGTGPSHTDPPYIQSGPGIVYDDKRGMRFAAALECRVEDGDCEVVDGTLCVRNSTRVVVLLSCATSFTSFDKQPWASERNADTIVVAALDNAEGFDNLLVEHVTDYRRYFSRVSLDLGNGDQESLTMLPTDQRIASVRDGMLDNGLATLLFQYGRYLLISSSRPGSAAANLQGIWNEEVRPPWSSNYTLNINVQMNYWLAEPANLPEMTAPLFDLVNNLAITGESVARSYYGCPGWCAGHNSDIWARANPVGDGEGNPAWANWVMGGAWLVQNLWEHYLFNPDKAVLASKIFPLMSGVAEFLLGFVDAPVEAPSLARATKDRSADGSFECPEMLPHTLLTICPSTSPENEFVYKDAGGALLAAPIDKSTTFDCAIVREVLTNTIMAAAVLGVHDNIVRRCEETLPLLPSFDVAPEGHLVEYCGHEEYDRGHRHLSHLYGHHPGALITRTRTPELADAVRKALNRRLSNGSGHTGWSRAWLICQLARLGDAERAHDSVVKLIAHSTYPNLLDAHPPFQIDGNFGATAGIAEMLLQSHDGFVDLLPALPQAWTTGSARGLRARGAVEVDVHWRDGQLCNVTLRSNRKGESEIRYRDRYYMWRHNAQQAISLDGTFMPVVA